MGDKVVVTLTPRQAEVLCKFIIGALESSFEQENNLFRLLGAVVRKIEVATDKAIRVKRDHPS